MGVLEVEPKAEVVFQWSTRPNGAPELTFKGVAIESGLVVAFFQTTGLEGGLVRILARSCFQVAR